MAPSFSRVYRHKWQDPIGRETIQRIVKLRVKDWKDGLRDWQLNLVSRILDGEDILVSTATGDGKSAVFAIPILVLLEIREKPSYYPDLPCRELPMGIVITPTKGLAANIVFEIGRLGVKGLAYCSEILTEARKTGRYLWKEIAAGDWPLVCVDPEHLMSKDWEHITNSDRWRDNISFLCVDEVHLVYEWGEEFRPAFRHIGRFARSRCPPHISVFGMSATIEPGRPLTTICDTLGFVEGQFYHERRTNERPNIHFLLQSLSHTLGGDTFPDLLPFLMANRKTVIYCNTIELCWRVVVYLWGLLPHGTEKLTRVRLYHVLCWPEENEETVRLIRDDPRCQVVVATIAFAQGFNIKPLLDSLQLGVASTLNQLIQEEGRIGRDGVTLSRGVVLVQPKALEAARKYMRVYNSVAPTPMPSTKSRKKEKIIRMDHSKARLLVEEPSGCHTALRNIIYENAPLDVSSLNCVAANRKVLCGLCLSRSRSSLQFPPSATNPLSPPLPSFRVPPLSHHPLPSSVHPPSSKRALPLTMKMRKRATTELNSFRDIIRRAQKGSDPSGYVPRAYYFPNPLIATIIDTFSNISSDQTLVEAIPTWRFHVQHGGPLLSLILKLQVSFANEHEQARLLRNEKSRARAKAKRLATITTATGDNLMDEETTHDQEPDDNGGDTGDAEVVEQVVVPTPIPHHRGQKRTALGDETNQTRLTTKRPRAPAATAAEYAETLRPRYTARSRRQPTHNSDENSRLN